MDERNISGRIFAVYTNNKAVNYKIFAQTRIK